jgi:hypothetical protein
MKEGKQKSTMLVWEEIPLYLGQCSQTYLTNNTT